jgi:dehydrogenase/reductase SDR family member 7B
MSSNTEVVEDQSGGVISLILRLLKIPVNVVNMLIQCLFKREIINSLPGKVVLITGASSGLGEALAHTFYLAGCKVVLAARRKEELERVQKNLIQLQTVSFKNLFFMLLDHHILLFQCH